MKKLDIFKVKMWLYLFIEFACMLITGYLLSLVKEPYIGVALACWCVFLLLTGFCCIFFIILADRCYLLKYFFLGKNFKNKVNEFFKENPDFSEKEKKQTIKRMKDEYRRSGDISFICYRRRDFVHTVWNKNIHDIIWAKERGELIEEEKLDYVIENLAYGLKEFFYDSDCFLLTYDEFCKVIKNCKEINANCKKYLLSEAFKENFEFFGDLTNYTSEEIHDFANKNKDYYAGFDKFLPNICEVRESLAVKIYKEHKKFHSLPESISALYFSKDGETRMYIYHDESLNAYKIAKDFFTFYYDDIPLFDNEGGWHYSQYFNSIYETTELAINGIKEEIKNMVEISVDKIQNHVLSKKHLTKNDG